MKEKVKKVMSNIFQVPIKDITDDASPDTITGWDSLKHMNLVLALEEEFGVQFSDAQILELLNFQLILLTLKEVGVRE